MTWEVASVDAHGAVVIACPIAAEFVARREQRLRDFQRIARVLTWELDLDRDVLTWVDPELDVVDASSLSRPGAYAALLAHVHADDLMRWTPLFARRSAAAPRSPRPSAR